MKSTGLTGYLKEKGIKELYFCGLAAEYCVYFSIKDALSEGFEATLIEDATRSLDQTDFENAKIDILSNGGRIGTSRDF